jgi:2-polyprenyl-6-methoxyphenol hydroxylase-like FAD-dependent oxidoreductase
VTHQSLFDILDRAGVTIAPADLGTAVEGRRVFDNTGAIVAQMELKQSLTSWGRLYSILRRLLPDDVYHTDMQLEALEETATGVMARFANGRVAHGDLLIGADGSHSTVRAAFAPELEPQYAGYVAWRGLVDETTLSSSTRSALCDHFVFCLPPGEQVLGYPVPGADDSLVHGKRRFNFVWYRPAAVGEALSTLLTDETGTRHELSIPPNLIRADVIASMRSDADRLLAPQFAEVIHRTSHPFLQAIVDLEAPRMKLGARIAILGDAAFVARPHVGMGVTKAAGDAAVLVEALAKDPDDIAEALSAYERERLVIGTTIIHRARQLGAYMQTQSVATEERQSAELCRSPQAVMSETAIAPGRLHAAPD